MLQLVNLSKHFGEKIILQNINLTIYDGEKIGIIGSNGQGKSTLLNIISEEISPDEGSVITRDHVGYLKQSADIELASMLQKLSDEVIAKQFYYYLSKFGINEQIDLNQDLTQISCGEKTKIALSMLLAESPNLVILDEPTNHLDLDGKKLLINLINELPQTVLIVSHDIDFLNNTINKVLELKSGELTEYYGNYDDYITQKENEQLHIQREYDKHKKNIADINRQIEVYKKALQISDRKKKRHSVERSCDALTQDERSKSLSKFASNRLTKLQQELNKDVERPEKEHIITYKLKADDLKAKTAIYAENLSKYYGDRCLFRDASFIISSGDKVAIKGANGVGKSTLIKMILEQTEYSGNLFVTPSLRIALLKQDIYDLDEEMTINQMSLEGDKQYRTAFLTNLISMNIDKTRFDTKIKFLSSGERMRIKITQIILSDANMIILDEPTNHLDIENKNYLQKVLSGFVGTLIIISHDADFLRYTTTKTLEIKNQRITLN